ncbi:MAG TPA: hypothetical protein VMB52_05365 [Verrucomicrobiae bacterium]|nr:hypothetical protein [Verrucomicrobiae bacterium]
MKDRSVSQPLWLLRPVAIRWCFAVLFVPGVVLTGIAVVQREPYNWVAAILAILCSFGCMVLIAWYFYKVLGAHIAYSIFLMLLEIGYTMFGFYVFSPTSRDYTSEYPNGIHIPASQSERHIWAILIVMSVCFVTAAVINGERWILRNGDSLPKANDKPELYKHPRGTLARWWLSR